MCVVVNVVHSAMMNLGDVDNAGVENDDDGDESG